MAEGQEAAQEYCSRCSRRDGDLQDVSIEVKGIKLAGMHEGISMSRKYGKLCPGCRHFIWITATAILMITDSWRSDHSLPPGRIVP